MAKKSRGIGLDSPVACNPANMSKEHMAQEKRWRAESDLRTLREAEQIRTDRSRLNMAKRIAGEEVKALQRVASGKVR